jgi:hypothetical protein
MALCIICGEGTLCAGQLVCGDPPDCNDPTCDEGGGGGDEFPPPLNATFSCAAITAPASYRLTLHGVARIRANHTPTLIAGRQAGSYYYGQPLILQCSGIIDRIEHYQKSHFAAFYTQNRYQEISGTGRTLTMQDGLVDGTTAIPLDNERQAFME